MPVQPPPIEIQCPHCGWHTCWQPRSDALQESDFRAPPTQCPRCGNEALQAHRVQSSGGVVEALWEKLRNLWGK